MKTWKKHMAACGTDAGNRGTGAEGQDGDSRRGLLHRTGRLWALWLWLAGLILGSSLAQYPRLWAQSSPVPFEPVRIHAGGGALTDGSGRIWAADKWFQGGFTYAAAKTVAGTGTPALYQTERSGSFSYAIPVPQGRYRVQLHFAEIYFTSPGKRIFSVKAEGNLAVADLDIVSRAGAFTAMQVPLDVEVADGVLNLEFVPSVENAKLSALEVNSLRAGPPPVLEARPLPSARVGPAPLQATLEAVLAESLSSGSLATLPAGFECAWSQTGGPTVATLLTPGTLRTAVNFQTPGLYRFRCGGTGIYASSIAECEIRVLGDTEGQPLVRINAGGGAYLDSKGQTWSADQYFTGGGTYTTSGSITTTADPQLYRSERSGTFSYRIPARSGLYEVRVHLAEIWFQSASSRIFNVNVEGIPLASNLDLLKKVPPMTPLLLTTEVRVQDGTLDLQFQPVLQNAKVSALEVLPLELDPPPLRVSAGADQSVQIPINQVRLDSALLSESGFTLAPREGTTFEWTQADGPAQAQIFSPTQQGTQVLFTAPGLYAFKVAVLSGRSRGESTVRVRVMPPPDPPGVLRIRCGGPAYTDVEGRIWAADQFYAGGSSYVASGSISATSDPGLYLTERTGSQFAYRIPVKNGTYVVRLHLAEIYWASPLKRLFSVSIENSGLFSNLDLVAISGPRRAVVRETEATVTDGFLDIAFTANADQAKVSALEILPKPKEGHYLHAEIEAPESVVDYAGAGRVRVPLVGSASHTHQIGRWLTRFEWKEGDVVLGTTSDIAPELPLGSHTVTLTIWDNNVPVQSLSESATVEVLPPSRVRGVTAAYFPLSAGTADVLAPASQPLYKEILPGFSISAQTTRIGGSALESACLVLEGEWTPVAGVYSPVLPATAKGTVWLDGVEWTEPTTLNAKPYRVRCLMRVSDSSALPLELRWQKNSGEHGAFLPVTHNQYAMRPQINRMPASGPESGGELIDITGLGFFPDGRISIWWGGNRVDWNILRSTPESLQLVTPPGSGTVVVQIETPQGISNPVAYTYIAGTAPVQFQTKTLLTLPGPTQAAWGPDGRLYVATLSGAITAIEFGENYTILSSTTIPALQPLLNGRTLGIGFNPWEPPGAFQIYAAHGHLFAGETSGGAVPFSGQISGLPSPSFQTVTPILTGLPCSNHDHGVNGITFDNRGSLLFSIGGNTNAGVPAPNLGDVDESPLSASINYARLRDPGFDGRLAYVNSTTGFPTQSALDGLRTNLSAGSGVGVFAPGFRNSFDLVWTTRGMVYATDNGPNVGFGKASLSATTEAGDPSAMDKVVHAVRGQYYGHANRNRGRFDPRQNRYRNVWEQTSAALYAPPLVELPSSKNGIDEYRATTFGGALRGALLVQHWNAQIVALRLSADGKSVDSVIPKVFGTFGALDLVCGPGGAILGVDYSGGELKVAIPIDSAASGNLVAYDVFPWRAPASGAFSFVIGGGGFADMASTQVLFGTKAAALTSVTPTRIKGWIPAEEKPTAAFLPVSVKSGGRSAVIADGFRYLLEPGQGTGVWKEEPAWSSGATVAAAAEVDGVVYTLGETSDGGLQAYNPASGRWETALPAPPVSVQWPRLIALHGAVAGRGTPQGIGAAGAELLLLGQPVSGGGWVPQIYNPQTAQWRSWGMAPASGPVPAAAESGGKVFLCGAGAGGAATSMVWSLDLKSGVWSTETPLPFACTEAAVVAVADRIAVLGGVAGEGGLTLQSFSPSTGTWDTPTVWVPAEAPTRYGAAAVTFNQEVYLFGGRFADGQPLSRVDAILWRTRKLRSEMPLPTPAFGAGVVAWENTISVLGGRNLTQPLIRHWSLVR